MGRYGLQSQSERAKKTGITEAFVLREQTQHLASVAGYHMGPDSSNPRRLNAWILDKFQKFERGAFGDPGGHLWPQTCLHKIVILC